MMPKQMTSLVLIGAIAVAVGFFVLVRNVYLGSGAEKYTESKLLMGTVVRLDVCRERVDLERVQDVYNDIWARMEEISWRMNVLDDRSDVARINHSNGKPVLVGEDIYDVIREAIRFSRATQGAFDITVWPLIKLWKEAEAKDEWPSAEAIAAVLQVTGSDNIQLLPDNHVRIHNSKTYIDLGGIAKGYAIDEAARIFRENHVRDFYIDAGGDIYVGGLNCKGESWRIGIRDPRDQSSIIDVVGVSNGAVTTSGNYEQYFEIGEKRLSHILDPETGYPQEDVVSATVIAPTAMEADAQSTTLCVQGHPRGTEYIDSLGEQHAGLIVVRRGNARIEKFASQEYKKFQIKK